MNSYHKSLDVIAGRKFITHRKRAWLRFTVCALVVLLLLNTVRAQGCLALLSGTDVSENNDIWVEQTLKQLSIDEKVGQLLQVRYFADSEDFDRLEYKELSSILRKYHIGSVVLGMHFNKSGPIRSSAVLSAKVANRIQHDAKVPLLIAADIERGVASRLADAPSFPWPMAFGAIQNIAEVERFAGITAREARAVGIQWALAPVADVNSNPGNPAVNTRSFGERSEQVASLVAAYIRGAHANGLLVTAKHFPGNGNTSTDPHRHVATIEGDLIHLQKSDLVPFRTAIDSGVDSIMLAHAKVPAIESDPWKITTTSSKIVTDLLKNTLHFNGVVVTDALEMHGIMDLYTRDGVSPTAIAAVDAIKAGCDVIMIPSDLDGAFHALIDAIRGGEIPEARIDNSVRKILTMKASVGLHMNRFVDLQQALSIVSKSEDMEFAQHISDEAVTLVRDEKRILPFERVTIVERSMSEGKLVAILLSEAFTDTDGEQFQNTLKARRPDAKIFRFDNRSNESHVPELLEAVDHAKEVVVAAYVAHSGIRHIVVEGKLLTSFGLLGGSGRVFEQILHAAAKKTAVIALGNPYIIVNFPEIQTYICTYSQGRTSEISAVKALFGEIENHASLPVTLPGIAPAGFSLPWRLTERTISLSQKPEIARVSR